MGSKPMNFQAPPRNGRYWTFVFDADAGASARMDGELVGVISVADLRQLLRLAPGARDIDIEADEIIHRLREHTRFPEGEDSFPNENQLKAVVIDWLNGR
jgi:hypothetical protein